MKKMPLLLSGLALTASSANLTTATLATNITNREGSLENASYSLASDTLAINALSSDGSIRSDHVTFDPYEHRKQVTFDNIDTSANTITLRFNDLSSGWKPQKAAVGYLDYENGITEAEADKKLATLTDEETDWEVRLLTQRFNDVPPVHVYAANPSHKLADNKTDIIYYAVQYAREVTDENGETQLVDVYWLRGKVNYRKCAHSSIYDRATMACYLMINTSAQEMNYLPITKSYQILSVPADEEISSWDTEWQGLLSREVSALQERLEVLRENLTKAESILEQSGVEIGKFEKMANTDALATEVKNLKELLKSAQAAYDDLTNGVPECPVNDEEVKQLQQKLAVIEDKLAVSESECQKLQAEIVSLREEVSALSKENEGLRGEMTELSKENENLKKEMTELSREDQESKKEAAELSRENEELKLTVKRLSAEKTNLEHGNSDLMARNTQLEADRQSMQTRNQELTEEVARLQQQVDVLNQQLTENDKSSETVDDKDNGDINDGINMAPEASSGSLEGEKNDSAVIQPDEQKDAQSSSETVQGAKDEVLEANIGVTSTMQSDRVEVNTETEALDAASSVEVKDEKVSNEEVEVPNLGETETKVNFWWVLVGVIGLIGAAAMWIRRVLVSKIRR